MPGGPLHTHDHHIPGLSWEANRSSASRPNKGSASSASRPDKSGASTGLLSPQVRPESALSSLTSKPPLAEAGQVKNRQGAQHTRGSTPEAAHQRLTAACAGSIWLCGGALLAGESEVLSRADEVQNGGGACGLCARGGNSRRGWIHWTCRVRVRVRV